MEPGFAFDPIPELLRPEDAGDTCVGERDTKLIYVANLNCRTNLCHVQRTQVICVLECWRERETATQLRTHVFAAYEAGDTYVSAYYYISTHVSPYFCNSRSQVIRMCPRATIDLSPSSVRVLLYI
jgi:hypothetical protein